jgi:hypothetical protein
MSDDDDPFAAMAEMLDGGASAPEDDDDDSEEVEIDDDFAALEAMMNGGGEEDPPAAEPEKPEKSEKKKKKKKAAEVAEEEPPVRPSSPGSGRPLTGKEARVGLAVERIDAPEMAGIILKKEGGKLQVDFSACGGKPKAWVALGELTVSAEQPEEEEPAPPEPEEPVEPLRPEDVAVGMAVVKVADAQATGSVLKRDGARVRVDFSASGGPASKWLECSDLAAAGGAAAATEAVDTDEDDDERDEDKSAATLITASCVRSEARAWL